jgi:hypothetical protein
VAGSAAHRDAGEQDIVAPGGGGLNALTGEHCGRGHDQFEAILRAHACSQQVYILCSGAYIDCENLHTLIIFSGDLA